MEYPTPVFALIFGILLLLSGFFSGSETAFFSISAGQFKKMRHEKGKRHKTIIFLLSHPQQLLITIIIGNTIVNVSLASIAAILTHHLAKGMEIDPLLVMLLDVVVVTMVLLIVSEITPKVIAVEKPVNFAKIVSVPMMVFYFLFFPVAYIIHKMISQLQQTVIDETEHNVISEDEIKTLVEVGAEKGTLHEEERAMLTSLFEFGETIVREIMIPRPDMICVEQSMNFDQVMDIVKKTMISRIPVYKEKIDDITGILYVKDLLPFTGKRNLETFSVQKILHSPYFVPESKKIQDLLKEFQSEKIHMAIVVDEYGAVQGLITLEDIIEEIVGEIQDEYDKEEVLIHKINDDVYLVNGKVDIDEAEELIGIQFEYEDEDIESLGGFLLTKFRDIPRENESIDYKNFRFYVEKVVSNRIQKIKIVRITDGKKTSEE